MGAPTKLAITARTASKFCARSRSQSQNIFSLDLISLVISRNDLGNQIKIVDISTSRPASGAAFRGGSCCDGQIGWGPHICKVLPGCMIARSKTPTHVYGTTKLHKLL